MNPSSFSYLINGGNTFAFLCSGLSYSLAFAAVGKISGAHLNSALTLSSAIWKNTAWKAVPFYLLGQTLGAVCGMALVYTLQIDAIREVDIKKPYKAALIMISSPQSSTYR